MSPGRDSVYATRGERSGWWRLAPLAALWVAPLIAVAVAVPLASQAERDSASAALPENVDVGLQTTDYRTAVSAVVDMQAGATLRSSRSGLVTSLTMSGEAIRSGDELLSVDGTAVLAHVSDVPFFRELRRGDEGADVRLLGEFLAASGYLDESMVDEAFGAGVAEGVERLQERLGVVTDGVFRPDYVMFVPGAEVRRSAASVEVGSFISSGETVFEAEPTPVSLSFLPVNTNTSLANLSAGPLTMTVGDQQHPLSSLHPEGEELAQTYLRLRGDGGAVSAQATDGDTGSSERYDGLLLSLTEPIERHVVPGTAIFVTETGSHCVFSPQGDTWTPSTLSSLEPAPGVAGTMFVVGNALGPRVARDALSLPSPVLEACGV